MTERNRSEAKTDNDGSWWGTTVGVASSGVGPFQASKENQAELIMRQEPKDPRQWKLHIHPEACLRNRRWGCRMVNERNQYPEMRGEVGTVRAAQILACYRFGTFLKTSSRE